jgi:hypothetical protein
MKPTKTWRPSKPSRRKGRPTPEGLVRNACLRLLLYNGWKAWKNNTGARAIQHELKDGTSRRAFVRFGALGSGDIFALKNGVFLNVETKAGKKLQTEAQLAWARDTVAHGGFACLVRSVDQLADYLSAIDQYVKSSPLHPLRNERKKAVDSPEVGG